MAKSKNPRKRACDAICTKIATFLVSETFTDEGPAQEKLGAAIKLIDEASALLVAADEAHEAQKRSESDATAKPAP